MLRGLARFSYRRRWLVLVLWIATVVGITAASGASGSGFSEEFRIAGTDSQAAFDLLDEAGLGEALVNGSIVVRADAGLDDPEVRARLDALVAEVEQAPHVARVVSPTGGEERWVVSPLVPEIAYTEVRFDAEFPEITADSAPVVRELAAQASGDGLAVELGGNVFSEQGPPEGTAELIGLVAAVFILLVAFGSVLAMGLPIVTALFGLGVGFGVVGLLTTVVSVPEFATQLAAMIGIGVGIDYALFIVTRYRQGLANGLEPEDAVVAAIDTAGRAVLFAGATVVISLAGMLLIGIEFVGGLGVAAAAVVAVTMATSVTLLPAVLGFVGRTIDRLSLPGAKARAESGRRGFWWRWSRTLQARPWPAALVGLVVLLAMSAPVLSMRLGSSDAGNRPTSDTTRRAYDLKTEGFGEGFNGQFVVVARAGAEDAPALGELATALAETPGVAAAFPPSEVAEGIHLIPVFPETGAQDEATVATVERIRSETIPAVVGDRPIEAHVGGITALFEDMSEVLEARLPLFIGVVLTLSFLLLLVVFRSVLVPLKAVFVNLLSLGAAYGLVIAVFQWGWGAELIGVGKPGPIESFLPMMMFAILFGLSMDYEVFLLSRIKEEYDRTGDNGLAVADGLSATARVITAAALIMVTVFGSFMFVDERVVKMFGLGLAAAILIDATIVRMVLVPATMELLGRTNWWFPRWLSWLPVVHVEGAPEEIAVTTNHDEDAGTGVDDEPDPEGGRPVTVAR